MNRELLYRYLETRFSEAGFPADEVRSYAAFCQSRYAAMSDREISAEVERFGGPEQLADNAVARHAAFVAEQAAVPVEPPAVENTNSDGSDGDGDTAHTITIERSAIRAASVPVEKDGEEAEDDMFEAITPEEIVEIEKTSDGIFPDGSDGHEHTAHTFLYFKTYRGKATEEKKRKFKTLFYATSPLWALALLFCAVVLHGAFALLYILIPAAFVALLAYVAVGSGISLVGIIYGISQIFLSLPKGLDEIGIGVMAVGATLIGGILIYNFSIRLMPFAIHHMKRFLRYTYRFVPELFYYIRGEVYRR